MHSLYVPLHFKCTVVIKGQIPIHVNASSRSLYYSLRPQVLKQLYIKPEMFEIQKQPSLLKKVGATAQNILTLHLVLELR